MAAVTAMSEPPAAPAIRRLLGRVVAVALSLTALVAIVALLTGSFDDTDWKVLGTTLGFSVFSATAAAGATARLRSWSGAYGVGTGAVAASALAFVLLVAGLWSEAGDATWRWFGVLALAALALSHMSLVLGARRASDGPGTAALVLASVVLVGLDATGAALPITGVLDDVSDAGARLLAVCSVLLLLTTALPPLLRRAAAAPAAAPPRPAGAAVAGLPADRDGRALAADLLASVERLELAGGPPVEAELPRLRALAREVSRLR
jgi:hypothetical protein